MNVLLLGYGLPFQNKLFALNLSKYCDVKLFSFSGYEDNYDTNVEIDSSLLLDDVGVEDIEWADVIYGLDTNTVHSLEAIKRNYPDLKTGLQILDYPEHIIGFKSPIFNKQQYDKWNWIISRLDYMDFFVYSRISAYSFFSDKFKEKPYLMIPYPSVSFNNTSSTENFVLYCGRIGADRRIDRVIYSISKSKSKPKFIIVTDVNNDTLNFEKYAKSKGVDYEVLDKVSEKEKEDLLSKCLCTISAHYSPCPALCIAEGMSMGKNALSLEASEDNLFCFGDNIVTADNDWDKFTELLDKICLDKDFREKGSKDRIDFFNDKLTYKVWAENTYNFLKQQLEE